VSFHKSQISRIFLSPASLLLRSVLDRCPQIHHQVHRPYSEMVGAERKRRLRLAPGQPCILTPRRRFSATRRRLKNIWQGMASDFLERQGGVVPCLLAQRSITLVLILIISCSYITRSYV